MKQVKAGGGWRAIWYTMKKSREAGGVFRMYRALRSKNACKTCALGMGGQKGGMVNEAGHFPEVCKKSLQAMAADMQGAVPPQFFRDYSIEQMQRMSPRELEFAGRLTKPMYAGPLDSHYRPMEWDEAYEKVVGAMQRTDPDESFFYFSGRSSNEAGFLLQMFARLYGTNNVNNCSYYCHQASGVGLSSVTGSGTATVVLDDITKADLVYVIGCNPSSNHPRFMRTLMDVRRHDGTIVVVNPLREVGLERFKVPSDVRSLLFGTKIADRYVQPNIGGDIALLNGMLKCIIERDAVDGEFVEKHTEHWEACRAAIDATSWDAIVAQSGVERPTIEAMAEELINAKRVVFCWAMGITHHAHGVENVQALANLALARGMLGKPGCGLLPLRGHSNVQGIGSMGVTPTLKQAIFESLQEEFGVTLPTTPGRDTMDCMIAAGEGRMKFMVALGGNLFGSNPDAAFAAKAMQNIQTSVYLSTTLNTGHSWGAGRETIILPVQARDEEPQATTQESMFNYVRLSDGGPTRFPTLKSEVEIIASLAERYFAGRDAAPPVDWRGMQETHTIRAAIARIVPGYAAIGSIDDSKQEFQIEGRTFHEPRFATGSGKAQFHAVSLPDLEPLGDHELRLMTIRSEGQFNTVVYEEEDLYRGQERRDVLLMNASDIERLGLGDAATVSSDTGSMSGILVRAFDIPPGNAAMYYPECNVLVPRASDARSKTPAFKNVRVRVVGE